MRKSFLILFIIFIDLLMLRSQQLSLIETMSIGDTLTIEFGWVGGNSKYGNIEIVKSKDSLTATLFFLKQAKSIIISKMNIDSEQIPYIVEYERKVRLISVAKYLCSVTDFHIFTLNGKQVLNVNDNACSTSKLYCNLMRNLFKREKCLE